MLIAQPLEAGLARRYGVSAQATLAQVGPRGYVGQETQVLVAEMGTDGPGEIRAMCSWVKPEIGIITAIGPMRLERMKTLDTVARAKSELLEGVRVAILNIDHDRPAQIADSLHGAETWRCGTHCHPGLDVSLAAVIPG